MKEYARAIREIRPRFIVFENSPMLTSRGFEQVLCDLSGMGYDAEWRNFFATQFGFNHSRKRTYGIAYSSGKRYESYFKQGGILSKILQQQSPRQNGLPMSFERFNDIEYELDIEWDSRSSYSDADYYDFRRDYLDREFGYSRNYGSAIIENIAHDYYHKSIVLL